jgi:hypothetical protein
MTKRKDTINIVYFKNKLKSPSEPRTHQPPLPELPGSTEQKSFFVAAYYAGTCPMEELDFQLRNFGCDLFVFPYLSRIDDTRRFHLYRPLSKRHRTRRAAQRECVLHSERGGDWQVFKRSHVEGDIAQPYDFDPYM